MAALFLSRAMRRFAGGATPGTSRAGRAALAALLVFLSGSVVQAQTGGLRFRVLDAGDRSPIPGAHVTLRSDIRAIAPVTFVTDGQGEALFPVLPPKGTYSVEVFSPGYQRIRMGDLRIAIGVTRPVVFLLTRDQQETVIVEASLPTVPLEEMATSTSFSDKFLQDLPILGRFYQNMLVFAPGVQDADADGNPNVHGARDRDFKAIVSGVSNQDPLTGHYLGQVNLDSVEEIEIITAGAGVEFGRAQGGFANIVQKQGSNDLEGVASFYFRSDELDGNGASGVPPRRLPDFEWLQPAFHLSGPIRRDRLWYRFSHEYISEDRPVDILGDLAVTTRRQQIHDDQITWQVSPRNKLALQYRYDPVVLDNFGVSSIRPAESSVRLETGGPTVTATWTAPYSPKLLMESWVAYQDYRSNILPSAEGVRNACVTGVASIEESQCFDNRTGLFSGGSSTTWRDRRQRLTVRTGGTFFLGRHGGMNHVLRFGFQVENERYFRFLDQRPFLFADREFLLRPGSPHLEIRDFALTTVSIPRVSRSRATGVALGLYAEDEIKPRSNLLIKLGVRLDQEYIDSTGFLPFDPQAEGRFFFENRSNTGNPVLDAALNRSLFQQAFTAYEGVQGPGGVAEQFSALLGFPLGLSPTAVQGEFWRNTRRPGDIHFVNTNVAPRLAVSWDPRTDGKTAFRLTVGRYYDKIFLAVPTLELDPLTLSVEFQLPDPATGSRSITPKSSSVNPTATVRMVDRNLRTPHQDEVTVSFERELPLPETSIRVAYVRRRFRDQLQDLDLNQLPDDHGRCHFQEHPLELPIVPSPGAGQSLTDFFTGEEYVDTDPGPGDGRLDDCGGLLEPSPIPCDRPGSGLCFVQRPDGIADFYVQNPAWGSLLVVGNSNTADYVAYVLEVVKRQYRNWQMQGSYTYSRAIGDAEDFALALGNDRSLVDDERGYQSFDVRHSFKLNWTAQVAWLGGLRLGSAMSWQSGLPYSVLRLESSRNVIPPAYGGLGTQEPVLRTRYVMGRRNDQRNPSYWNVDVRVAKELSLRGGRNLQLTAEVFNLLNDGTLVIWNPLLRYGQTVNGRIEGTRRFGRQFQVGFRLAF